MSITAGCSEKAPPVAQTRQAVDGIGGEAKAAADDDACKNPVIPGYVVKMRYDCGLLFQYLSDERTNGNLTDTQAKFWLDDVLPTVNLGSAKCGMLSQKENPDGGPPKEFDAVWQPDDLPPDARLFDATQTPEGEAVDVLAMYNMWYPCDGEWTGTNGDPTGCGLKCLLQ